MSLRRPVKVGKYEVVDVIGRGGMGVVYKATDPHLGRSVAIKMMTMDDYVNNPEMLQRFYREAKSTGNLHHRNIVTVYELGDQDGSPYLVMEFLEGQTLDACFRARRALSLLERIDVILEVCEGLAYAHEQSVIHRDIKPGNIMVLVNGGVKIVDFGIAHIGNRTVTRTGQLLGSLPYMSPEQIGGKQVDGRSDIFSLGTVFYQLLTFELPFEGDTPAATLLKIMYDQPRPLADYNQAYPSELDGVLLRALAKNREERYTTAREFALDLLQLRGRIQQEVVDEHLNEAESLLLQGELLKSREKLSHVLKIDRYNTKAVELSRITQQHLERQETGQRVGELRRQAEEAYRQDQFVVALDLIQQALSLHSTDPDLQRLRVNVQQAKSRAERLQRSIERAELAYQQGELDAAKQAIDEALAVSPDDAKVKTLHENIQHEWTQRARRLQFEGLIEEARREIASRNFTLALKVLRTAEEIDPCAPQLKALIEAAQTAREQEQRRRAIEAIRHQIEASLDHDDFELACTKAQAALQDFPDDRSLQKLAELAEKQRSLAERKHFIDEQVSQARKLLEVGRTEEALEVLQSAQEKIGGDPHVESLLGVVRETLERQRREAQKAEFLRRAKDLLRRKEYADCIRALEEAKSDLGHNAEIDDLLQFALEQSSAEKRRQIADAAAERARTLIENQNYESAVTVLEDALREAPDEELRLVLVQARHAAAEHRKRLQDALANADSMMQGQRPVEALKYLRSQPASFSRDLHFVECVKKAEQQVERVNNIEHELEKARVHLRRDEYDQARCVATEAAHVYADAPEFSKLLSEIEERQAQHLVETVEAGMAEARTLIASGNPEGALDHLAALQSRIGAIPAKLTASFSALKQEAANAKARKFKTKGEQLLAEGEHEKAAALLQTALEEFPKNRDLQQLKKSLDQAIQRRVDAQNQISRAQESFQSGAWRAGGDKCLHAAPFASRDPVICRAVLAALEHAAADCVEANWREAEYLRECMTSVQPSAVLPAHIVRQIEQNKQDEAVLECLDEAKELQAHGEIDEALRRIEIELGRYPRDNRLSDLKQSLEKSQRKAEDRARRQREKQSYIDDVERRLKLETKPDDRIRILEEALRAYPEESTFTRELSTQQTLWQSVTFLVEEANALERSKRYDEAIQSWQAIREMEVSHPDLESSLTRLNLSKLDLEREIRLEAQSQIQESKASQAPRKRSDRSSLTQIPSSKKEPKPEKDFSTKIWRESPLPTEVPRPDEAQRQLGPVPVANAKNQKVTPSKSHSPRRPVKLYAGIAACIVAAVFFGSITWKSHQSQVTPPAARQSAPQALVPSALAPVATAAPVRLELRDAKPNSLVVIDSQPKGKINRHGTFSTELVAGNHQIQWTAKNKLSGTVTRHFAGDAPVRLTSTDLVPDKPSIPSAAPNTEQTEWERIKDSQTPADIEQFLARYPSTSFTSEAQAHLENLYWTNAAGRNTIGAYNQYLDRYSQGAHAQQARDNITELDWRSVETSGDATALDAFIRKHPSGSYHDQAVNKLDDVIWQKTKQNDASSLRSYLQNFSEGHHAIEAKKRIEELTLVASTPPKAAPVAPPPLDEKKAVLDVLGRYRKAYEGHDLGQLREIWPGMSAQQVKSLGDFFAHVSGLSMEYRVLGGPSVEADHATVTFQQSLQYLVNGRPGRDSATVTMRLRKPQSIPGTWRIDSIR